MVDIDEIDARSIQLDQDFFGLRQREGGIFQAELLGAARLVNSYGSHRVQFQVYEKTPLSTREPDLAAQVNPACIQQKEHQGERKQG
jgi:hypothetical protein